MEELIRDWGYVALFAYSFGGGFVGLVFAGILSYAGDLNLYICILVAGVSNFLGDQFLFFLARKNKSYAKDMMKKIWKKNCYGSFTYEKIWLFRSFLPKVYLWNQNINSFSNGTYKVFRN